MNKKVWFSLFVVALISLTSQKYTGKPAAENKKPFVFTIRKAGSNAESLAPTAFNDFVVTKAKRIFHVFGLQFLNKLSFSIFACGGNGIMIQLIKRRTQVYVNPVFG